MSKFKIQGVGLDTTSLNYPLSQDDHYDYIVTNLVKNNDYLLRGYFETNNSPLIVKTPYLDSVEITLNSHLRSIRKEKVDLLLVEPEADWEKAEKISFVGEWGISHPTSVDEVGKVDSVLKEKGLKLSYILLSACPLDYNKELFGIAETLGLRILIDNPIGGYVSSPRNIEAFSVPYLLAFAANQGEIVFLSSRDLVKAAEGRDYLKALIGKESNQMFELKKTIQRPVKSLKKVIYTSTKIGKDIIIPYDCPELITITEDTVFNIAKWQEKLPTIENSDPESVEEKVRGLLKVTHIPEDANKEAKFTHLRYRVEDYLEGCLEGYDLEYTYTDSILFITATLPAFEKGWLWWYKYRPEKKRYFCFLLNKDGEPIFYEVDSEISAA